MRYEYTKEFLTSVVKDSVSFTEVLRKLKRNNHGRTHQRIKKQIRGFNIDTTHFTGRRHWLNKPSGRRLSALEYIESSYVNPPILRKKLIEDGLKKASCENCGRVRWIGKPIPLELHHVDGDDTNHKLENLQVLCSNCHTQTENYGSKNGHVSIKRIAERPD